ncbi:MAG: Rne/Rng family ribonuclease [Candidatus Omnitrophica bacterium]|nr:Rne/Rng family ribonuclease [Candidatus Omnitrophota bacterium]
MNQKQKHGETEILINVGPIEKRIAIISNGKLDDYFMEREGLENYAGSVYKGVVKSIIPGIEAAFIEIGLEKNGFLHVSDVLDKGAVLKDILDEDDSVDGEETEQETKKQRHFGKGAPKIGDLLSGGQEIMVQVVKEAISTKGARLTTYVSIPGRYIVLTPFDAHIGVSKRIKDREKRRAIREIIGKIQIPVGVGCIVRTMAEDITEKEIHEEMHYLLGLWDKIKSRAASLKGPGVVYEEYGAVLRMVRDKFTNDVAHLVVDSKDEFSRIMNFLKAFRPELRKKVRLHNGPVPLFARHDIDKQIDAIFERRVSLKCGGNIVIEQTEGLVAIDVNTGKFVGKNNFEDTAFKTNIEAAREIPRQLLMRDIGGIVIIDFIDMDTKHHRDEVFRTLEKELENDKAKINLRSISQFGVVEMTRQRMRKSLESSSHVDCPYCGGRGVIKSPETVAIEAVRRIERVLTSIHGRKHIVVTAHPDVVSIIMDNQAKIISDIQRKFRCRIDMHENIILNREEVLVEKK